MRKIILFIFVIFLFGSFVSSNQVDLFNSDQSLNETFTTIQECADVVTAGQTCLVHEGVYDEYVTPAQSGVQGSKIIFKANGDVKMRGFNLNLRGYIIIDGFEITNEGLSTSSSSAIFMQTSNDIEIINNHIHNTTYHTCIRMRSFDPPGISGATNYTIIRNNTISDCNMQSSQGGAGMQVSGYHNLVEDNTISSLGDDFIQISGGAYNVIRNNLLVNNSLKGGSSTHIDGVDADALDYMRLDYTLVEGNTLLNSPDTHTHFIIYSDQYNTGSENFIVRYNHINEIGSGIEVHDTGVLDVYLYSNTFKNTSVAYDSKPWSTAGAYNNGTGHKIINNIFMDTIRDFGNVYSYDASSTPGFFANYNLGYNTECGESCTWSNPANGISNEPNAVLNQNPLLIEDLSLINGSPAIDNGGPLTNVLDTDTGSGTQLIVNNSGFFQSGWAGVEPDWIAVGAVNNVVQISSIDYDTNTITLNNSILRNGGDAVWLYKDSSGKRVLYGNAPDIGAYEYTGDVSVPVTGNYYYVRSDATGRNDGSDWENAFTEIPVGRTPAPEGYGSEFYATNYDNCLDYLDWTYMNSFWCKWDTLERGATYYIADGEYGSVRFSTPENGTQDITIKKAIEEDHGTDVGFNSNYGDGQAVFNSSISFVEGYHTFDGVNGEKDNSSSYGFKFIPGFDCSKRTNSHIAISFSNGWGYDNLNNIRIHHTEFENCGRDYRDFAQTGIKISQSGKVYSDIHISHNFFHDACYGLVLNNVENSVFEHNYFKHGWSNQGICNGEAIATHHNYNNTLRYNVFDAFMEAGGTGVVVLGKSPPTWTEPSDGDQYWDIYGNVIINCVGATGAIGTDTDGGISYSQIHHNTIINSTGGGFGSSIHVGLGIENYAYNNIWSGLSWDSLFHGDVNHDYTFISDCEGCIISEENLQIGSGDPFVDWQNGDFRLKEGSLAIDAGLDLGSPFNIDADGVNRDDYTPWDIGAYEYIPLETCNHPAEQGTPDCVIDIDELTAYVNQWKTNLDISINSVMDAISKWKAGSY